MNAPSETSAVVKAELASNTTNYIFVWVMFICTICVVSIPLIPIVAIVYFAWYRPRYMHFHSLTLTEQTVEVKRGVVFRTQTSIPLDRVTDVSVNQGPLMRFFDIYSITVESAGQTQLQGSANMLGVIDPYGFRSAVMRNAELYKRPTVGDAASQAVPAMPDDDMAEAQSSLLREIRDILVRMERSG